MTDNPYASPANLIEPNSRQWSVRGLVAYLVTSVVIGALAGSAVMFCYHFFIVAPVWEPRIIKGDKRWETIYFISSTLLPFSVSVGIAVALGRFAYYPFRLNHRGVLISCLVLYFLIINNRPVVSRIRRPDIPAPKYETVPDTMLIIVSLLFVVTTVSSLIQWRRTRNSPHNRLSHDAPVQETAIRSPLEYVTNDDSSES